MLCGCRKNEPHNIWTYRVVRKIPLPNLQHTACKRSWILATEVRNMSSHQTLRINSVMKYCVSGWSTCILQSTSLRMCMAGNPVYCIPVCPTTFTHDKNRITGHIDIKVWHDVWFLKPFIWDFYFTGQSKRKGQCFGRGIIDYCEKQVRMNMCIILSGYRDRTVWIDKYKSIVNGNKECYLLLILFEF